MKFKDEKERPLFFNKGHPLLVVSLRRLDSFSEFLHETFGDDMGGREIVVRYFSPETPNKVKVEISGWHSYWRGTIKKELKKMNFQNSKVKYDHVIGTRGEYLEIETDTGDPV